MDQSQLNNYSTIQALTQKYQMDGFIRDRESQIPQALFAMPVAEQDMKPAAPE